MSEPTTTCITRPKGRVLDLVGADLDGFGNVKDSLGAVLEESPKAALNARIGHGKVIGLGLLSVVAIQG